MILCSGQKSLACVCESHLDMSPDFSQRPSLVTSRNVSRCCGIWRERLQNTNIHLRRATLLGALGGYLRNQKLYPLPPTNIYIFLRVHKEHRRSNAKHTNTYHTIASTHPSLLFTLSWGDGGAGGFMVETSGCAVAGCGVGAAIVCAAGCA